MSPNADVAITHFAAETISPFARRFVAVDKTRRSQPTGLRTYIVGHGEVALIDPDWTSGPLMEAILDATEGELITHVLITHDHGRRASIGAQLAERFGADVVSGASGLRDGERIYGLDWTLEAIKTPGHTPDHFAFALAEEQTVFCGDLVTGWAPEIVTPPGGDLSALLASR
jgi:glyoxylase-like metal-dependent hydrolase (beta-lactamase superfamily II)